RVRPVVRSACPPTAQALVDEVAATPFRMLETEPGLGVGTTVQPAAAEAAAAPGARPGPAALAAPAARPSNATAAPVTTTVRRIRLRIEHPTISGHTLLAARVTAESRDATLGLRGTLRGSPGITPTRHQELPALYVKRPPRPNQGQHQDLQVCPSF